MHILLLDRGFLTATLGKLLMAASLCVNIQIRSLLAAHEDALTLKVLLNVLFLPFLFRFLRLQYNFYSIIFRWSNK